MFTETTIIEVIRHLKLNELTHVIINEKASKVLSGEKFKENNLAFYVPSEKEFYKLTANPDANPVNNFLSDNQYLTISNRYGQIYFFNKIIDLNDCIYDEELGIYYFN